MAKWIEGKKRKGKKKGGKANKLWAWTIALHWFCSLFLPKPHAGREGFRKSTRPSPNRRPGLQHWEGGGLEGHCCWASTVFYVCLKASEWGRRSFSSSLCSALVKAGMTGGEREDAARWKDPTHPFCPYQTRLCSSSICYLRLPFCNDALFLVDAFVAKKKAQKQRVVV